MIEDQEIFMSAERRHTTFLDFTASSTRRKQNGKVKARSWIEAGTSSGRSTPKILASKVVLHGVGISKARTWQKERSAGVKSGLAQNA